MLEDWLLAREDPRAAIIELEKAGRLDDAARVRRDLHRQLLGKGHETLASVIYGANWRAGYVREANIASHSSNPLFALCKAPAARLLRKLTLTLAPSMLPRALSAIAGGVFVDTLHDLVISGVHVDPPTVDAALLLPLPRLRGLALRGAYMHAGRVERISSLVLAPTRYDIERLEPMLCETTFPAVTDLVLDFASHAAPELPTSTLEQLFGEQFVPRLERVTVLHGTVELARSTVGLLRRSPLLPQLRRVDLGPNALRFAHVELTVPDGY